MQDTNYDETNEVEETTSEETAPEENTDETTDDESTEETQEDESEDSVDWKERALKAEKAIEKAKKKNKAAKGDESHDPDRITRLELKAEGVKESEDQDYILRVAKAEGVDPVEAVKLEYVQDKLNYNKRQRQSAQATPRSNNRTGTQTDEVAMWVRRYQKDGSLPDDLALTAKVMNALKN